MIKLLPREVYDLIAAGEVVTSPLSVVKELVENALDAGAGRITVEILSGGMERIRVTDDGSGIAYDEISLAFMPHATSKISSADDLYNTSTLGFRGEALASIAAVAKITMLTKTGDAVTGARATVSPGESLSVEAFGADNGTDITVEHLFDNLPARKKHLHSARTEATKITDYLSRIAVFRADVSFRYLVDGILSFATRGQGDRLAAIQTVFGSVVAQNLVEIQTSNEIDNEISVSGFVSNPIGLRKTRKGQVFFVNSRPVKNAVLETAVSEAYKEFAEPGRFPIVFLFLEVPKSDIDVNIHPAKEEIALADTLAVQRHVFDTIRELLVSEKSIPKLSFRGAETTDSHYFDMKNNDDKPSSQPDIVSELQVSTYGGDGDQIITVDINHLLETNISNSIPNMSINGIGNLDDSNNIMSTTYYEQFKLNIPLLKVLASLFASYLLADDGESLYLIDQHAAHERVNFERFKQNTLEKGDTFMQELLNPYIFSPAPGAINILKNDPKVFADLGFEIEEFGEGVWRATSFPAFLKYAEAEAFLAELLTSASEGNISKGDKINTVQTERIIMRACRAAVKAGDQLNDSEIDELINELSLCDNPYTCPHGRPIFLKLSRSDIERLFKRAGAPG